MGVNGRVARMVVRPFFHVIVIVDCDTDPLPPVRPLQPPRRYSELELLAVNEWHVTVLATADAGPIRLSAPHVAETTKASTTATRRR